MHTLAPEGSAAPIARAVLARYFEKKAIEAEEEDGELPTVVAALELPEVN